MTGMDLPRSCGWKRSSSLCRGTTRSWSRSTQRQSARQTARFVARSRSSLGRSTVPSVSKPTWSASRTQLRKKLRFSPTASRSASTPRPSSGSSSAARCSVLSARWVTVVSSVIRIGSAVSKRKTAEQAASTGGAPPPNRAQSVRSVVNPAEFRADHPDANGCGESPPDQREIDPEGVPRRGNRPSRKATPSPRRRTRRCRRRPGMPRSRRPGSICTWPMSGWRPDTARPPRSSTRNCSPTSRSPEVRGEHCPVRAQRDGLG
jgi:hypothetical protein